jgi:hypothetical protein
LEAQYHVVCGRRVVATRSGSSARDVALDYLRSLGCERDESICFGPDGVAWRGAVYRARSVEARHLGDDMYTTR